MTEVKTTIKKLPVLLLTMVIIATALIVSGCGKTVIDLKEAKILDVDLMGFDGKGKVEVSVDEDNLKKLKKEYRDSDDYKDIKELLDGLYFELEDPKVNGKLNNGDTFNVIAKYDEDLAEEISVVLENTTITCDVKDKLPKGTEIDAFKGLKVKYYGDNGDAYAYIETDGCDDLVEDNNIYFDFENDSYELKNGDKIVVVAKSFNDLEDDGFYLKEESKEYTVEGLIGARTTLEGVALNDIAKDMYDEVEDKTEGKIYLAYYDYEFKSGKDRELSSFGFKYTPKLELVKYAYVYDPDDITYNNLVAYYKLSTEIECTDDQYGYKDDDNLMKKGDKDTGVIYIAIKSSTIKITADNKIDDEYMYFISTEGKTIEDCAKEFDIDDYTAEYYDKDFKKLDDTATEATEPATEKTTESATEATEASTEKTTKTALTSDSTEPTEKATTKKSD